MQVNFAGFRSVVDSVDGVPIYFNYPARDENTGLNIEEAGCHVLDGTQALGFARSRYYEALRSTASGRGPHQRPRSHRRQQYFIRAGPEAGDRARGPATRSSSPTSSAWPSSTS